MKYEKEDRIAPSRWPVTILLALFIVFGVLFSFISISKHQGFGSLGYDLGIFHQLIWKYSQLQTPDNTVRLVDNLLSDHFHPILMAIAPLYRLVPQPETLLVVQGFLFSSMVFPIYYFTKEKFSATYGLMAASLIGLFWGVREAVFYDFHEIAFAAPLLGWLIYFMDKRNFKGYWIILILLFLTKEEFWIFAVFSGLILVMWRYYWQAAVSVFGGVFGFIILTQYIMPALAGGTQSFQYLNQYDTFGDSTGSIILGALKNPFKVIETIFSPIVKSKTLLYMVGVFAFLPLLSPFFLIAVPSILQRMLSSNENLWTTSFHYTATIGAVLIMAMIDSLHRISEKFPSIAQQSSKLKPIYVLPLIVLLQFGLLVTNEDAMFRFQGKSYYSAEVIESGKKALQLIPDNASVVADDAITPHLANRDEIYRIADLQWRESRSFDYIIESDEISDYFVSPEQAAVNVQTLLDTYDYEPIFDENSWRVYKLQ